jgi:4-hydroxybenzoate polyprenyltransferase
MVRSMQPGGIGAYWRLLHPVPSLLTVLVAGAFVLLAARGLPPIERFLLLLLIETLMQFSISALNDYFDRDVDRGRPDKPVALGLIRPEVALWLGAAFGMGAVLLALPLGVWVTLLTAVGLAGGLLYDAGLKYTAFSWLPFALAFPTLPLWAWAGAYGSVPERLLWVWPVGAVLVIGIHLADTLPDLETDSAAGVRGLAHRLGPQVALFLCWGAFAGAVALTFALWAVIPYRVEWYVPGLVLGVLLIAGGIGVYLVNPGRVRLMSLMLEIGAIALAVGWVAGLML